MIPVLDLTRQLKLIGNDLTKAVTEVVESGYYILGPNVQAFEKEVAEFLSVKHAIGCASGTDALILACKALKIEPGDEIITTSLSYIATSEAIVHGHALPIFTDIDTDTFNMSVEHLARRITPKTKAILPVHLYGQPAEMDEILELARLNNLAVIEDCAQSIGSEYKGAKVGGIGDIGCFSFFPTKNLGALGDGGLVTTNNDELADRLRLLRVHAARTRYDHQEAGMNSRLDEMQAAALRVKLPHLNSFNERRHAIAMQYTEQLQAVREFVETPVVSDQRTHVFHQYTIKLKTNNPAKRDELVEKLREAGVMSSIYYPIPLYAQSTHADLNCNPADYPNSEQIKNQVLSLPMFPELTDDEIKTVTNAIKALVPQILSSELAAR